MEKEVFKDAYIMDSIAEIKTWIKDMKYEQLKKCMAKETFTKMEPRIWVTNMTLEQVQGPLGVDSILNLTCSINDDFQKLILEDHNIINKAVKQYYERKEPSCMCASGDTDGDILTQHAKELIAKHFNVNTVNAYLNIDRVIFNDPATIILWKSWHWEKKEYEEDGVKKYEQFKVQDKTIVKCSPGEKFNKYNGFCAAVAKRVFETNSAIQHIIREAQDNSDSKKLLKEIEKAGKKIKAQRENMKETKKK